MKHKPVGVGRIPKLKQLSGISESIFGHGEYAIFEVPFATGLIL